MAQLIVDVTLPHDNVAGDCHHCSFLSLFGITKFWQDHP